jgi:AmmeMemoRadiSam system protein B
MIDVRPSPIAGTWYPGDPQALARSVDGQLAEVKFEPPPGQVVGLVVPHAGHRYSGGVAAHAFRLVQGASFDNVAILGPMHQPYPASVLTTSHQAYATPLGSVGVATDAVEALGRALERDSSIELVRVTHDPEHSLEIELPFLQRTLAVGFQILPVMLRDQRPVVAEAVGHALAEVLRGRSALIVASSDLSHFYPSGAARRLDAEMLARMETFDPGRIFEAEAHGVGFACGKAAVAAALWAARDLGARGLRVLHYAHSGDVTGDHESVVGYAAGVIYGATGETTPARP